MSTGEESRKKIERLKRELDAEQNNLRRIESTCRHQWGPTVADHIYHESYTIAGDPVGTMGVDRRGPCYVPARTEQCWKRTCTVCGKTEHTSATNKQVVETPRFG